MIDESLWTARSWWRTWRRRWADRTRSRSEWKRFWTSYRAYQQSAPADRRLTLKFLYPCLGDDTAETPVDPIYYYQDAWAFERIVQQRPTSHVDVGSHHKFVSLLSKVVPLTMVDIRPPALALDSLTFRRGSILALPFEAGSVPSISSLCVVEHIGLGRYGDAIDPHGSEKAIRELQRVVCGGGSLYLSVPLHNENRTYFNAHRTFTEPYLHELFAPFNVVESRYIFGSSFGDRWQPGFGVGCYHLRRPAEIERGNDDPDARSARKTSASWD